MHTDKEQFAHDGSIVMAIASALGLPIPQPEDLSQDEAILCVAFSAIYELKRALNGKEDAEFILYLWNQAEEKIKQLNS